MNFVALDFETASPKRHSACSLALTVVQNNQIVDELYSLIKPETEFSPYNIKIHGITPQMVAQAPKFPELWPHIAPFFGPDKLIVAHNAPFDCSVLKKTLEYYQITPPNFLALDTVKTCRHYFSDLPNHKLNTVCQQLQISLEHHHNALDDSLACAKILLYQVQKFGIDDLNKFIKSY
ncbi:3'-5' exonuclease [Ligilactobacillus sp. Marseille-Q7487]|uniref:3'-5' exonuclease n=1 Tax=Ligilactobacillus sp. Marseille-Q7487 TaxID=3022128 RepID=UPI0024A9C1B5|nr:3'-5' exonuclease [Ligilactobacillus sp. Marseille-Q7487]